MGSPQAHAAHERALSHPALLKRMSYPVLEGSPQAWSIVTHVVKIGPGGYDVGPQFSQDRS